MMTGSCNNDDRLGAIELAVHRSKEEILKDIASGRVPATVSTFAQLHDYVGACDGDATDFVGDMPEEVCSFWNAVQSEVDQWLRKGRP